MDIVPVLRLGWPFGKKRQEETAKELAVVVNAVVKEVKIAEAAKLADMLEKRDDLRITFFALGLYVAGLDGISNEELDIIIKKVGDPNSNVVEKPLRDKYKAILDERPNFDVIKTKYLDAAQAEFLVEFNKYINQIIISDQSISEPEQHFLEYKWYPYLKTRNIEFEPIYVRKDYAEKKASVTKEQERVEVDGFVKLLKDAGAGDSAAMYNLGRAFEFGLYGKTEDMYAARNWYKKALGQGYSAAEDRLNEVAKKIEKIELKKRYSLKPEDLYDDATQLYNKGWRYEQGDGVVKDTEYAKVLYQKAAEKGNQMAKSRLNYLNIDKLK